MQFRIAETVFAVASDRPAKKVLSPGDSYRDFICDDVPDVTVCGHYDGFSDVTRRPEDKVFDSGVLWDVYRGEKDYTFTARVPSNQTPYAVAVFDSDFRKGDVYFSKGFTEEVAHDELVCPLTFPFFHLLMISFLAKGRGIILHACGIDDNGRGYLFAGSPEHGKTTMARLWEKSAVVLNDERIVLREQAGRLWIYGTPWHGDYENVSTGGIPLEKIFFLEKSAANKVRNSGGMTAASALLTHSFLPYWDRGGMEFVADFCGRVAEAVPCLKLGFVPDSAIVDFVRCVK